MNKNIEIISLIFSSVDFLRFITKQLKSDLCKAEGWEVGHKIVANDATKEVLEELPQTGVKYSIFNNSNPEEYYFNRVLRAYNYAVESSEYDNVCLINSDHGFSEGWLSNLLKHHDGVKIPCSKLVENFRENLPEDYFGKKFPEEFNEKKWQSWAKENNKDELVYTDESLIEKVKSGKAGGDLNGGHWSYMPAVFSKKRFIEAGKFPNGSIYTWGVGGQPITKKFPSYKLIKPGDCYFFHDVLEKRFNMKQVCVLDSLTYHVVEGEKNSNG